MCNCINVLNRDLLLRISYSLRKKQMQSMHFNNVPYIKMHYGKGRLNLCLLIAPVGSLGGKENAESVFSSCHDEVLPIRVVYQQHLTGIYYTKTHWLLKMRIKWIVHPKIKTLSSFINPCLSSSLTSMVGKMFNQACECSPIIWPAGGNVSLLDSTALNARLINLF